MSLLITNRLSKLQEEMPKTTSENALAYLEFTNQMQEVLHPEKIRDASIDYLTEQVWKLVQQSPKAAQFFGLPQDYPELKEHVVKPMVMEQRYGGIGAAPTGSDIRVLEIDRAPLSEKFNNFVNDIIQSAPEDKNGSLDAVVFSRPVSLTGNLSLGLSSLSSDGNHTLSILPTLGLGLNLTVNDNKITEHHLKYTLGLNEDIGVSIYQALEQPNDDSKIYEISYGIPIGSPINISVPLKKTTGTAKETEEFILFDGHFRDRVDHYKKQKASLENPIEKDQNKGSTGAW